MFVQNLEYKHFKLTLGLYDFFLSPNYYSKVALFCLGRSSLWNRMFIWLYPISKLFKHNCIFSPYFPLKMTFIGYTYSWSSGLHIRFESATCWQITQLNYIVKYLKQQQQNFRSFYCLGFYVINQYLISYIASSSYTNIVPGVIANWSYSIDVCR